MRAVVQRVTSASVKIDGKIIGQIGCGLCVFVAIAETDDDEIMRHVVKKIINLRIFNDSDGKMNLSAIDVRGEILLISNFTLYGDASRGFRPSFSRSARPEISEPAFDNMLGHLRASFPFKVASGRFGADMKVDIANDGPVTVVVEKEKGGPIAE